MAKILFIIISLSFSVVAIAKVDSSKSYFDTVKRVKVISENRTLYKKYFPKKLECSTILFPSPIKGKISIPYFYQDRAGYDEKVQPLIELENIVSKLTALYVIHQDEKYIDCLINGLKKWQQSGSLTSFDKGQGWVNVGWTATSIALNYSILKSFGFKNISIESWLSQITNTVISRKGGKKSCCNNLANWRGLLAITTGVVTENEELVDFGVSRFKVAISQMNADGSFPIEMTRGKKSLHYQNFAILPLVYIAQIASEQGINLFNYKFEDRSLSKAIDFLAGALKNPELIKKYNEEQQDLSFLSKSTQLSWLEVYLQSISNPYLEKVRSLNRPFYHRFCGGYNSLYFAKP